MSKKQILIAAAVAGLVAGSSLTLTGCEDEKGASAKCATCKHACKGQNACKSQGGCSSGDNGCKGKNSCKAKGGCKCDGGSCAAKK